MTSILQSEPVYIGRARNAPRAALRDNILKAVFLLPEHEKFGSDARQDQIQEVIMQVRAREALLHGYYSGLALIHASREELSKWPVLLEPGREYWVLGSTETFALEPGAAGNWNEGGAVAAAKGILGAQIYRLEALLLGATYDSSAIASTRTKSIHAFCGSHIRPRLDSILRATGSRKKGGDWLDYIGELRGEFGAPALRLLYGETAGARTKLKIGTRWRREGHELAPLTKDLENLKTDDVPAIEVALLNFAADILARATIAERDGVAAANRQEVLTDETSNAIVDIYSVPDLGLATEAALRWNINSADYFFRLGAFRGFFDATRSLGIYHRLKRVELPGLAAFGIRALMRIAADDFFEAPFTLVLDGIRQQMPSALIEAAEQASRDVPDRLDVPIGQPTLAQLMAILIGVSRETEDPHDEAGLG